MKGIERQLSHSKTNDVFNQNHREIPGQKTPQSQAL